MNDKDRTAAAPRKGPEGRTPTPVKRYTVAPGLEDGATRLVDERAYDSLLNSHFALVAALAETREQLHKLYIEGGGCDHRVGICWCAEQRALDGADAALKGANGYAGRAMGPKGEA